MLIEDINFMEKKANAILKSIDAIKKSISKSSGEFLSTTLALQTNAEKLCLKARLLPLRSGNPQAMNRVRVNMAEQTGISITPMNNKWIKIYMPALLPKKESGGVEYIRDSLNTALMQYFVHREKNIYSEPVILIFNHIYSKWYNGRRFRDHDNIEINAVADLLTLNFLADDNPTNCQHFQYTTEAEEDATVIYIIPCTELSSWIGSVYLKEMQRQTYWKGDIREAEI